jgi:plastocyanin domain-containing protein
MTMWDDVLVTVGGIALIAWVNWYFLLRRRD